MPQRRGSISPTNTCARPGRRNRCRNIFAPAIYEIKLSSIGHLDATREYASHESCARSPQCKTNNDGEIMPRRSYRWRRYEARLSRRNRQYYHRRLLVSCADERLTTPPNIHLNVAAYRPLTAAGLSSILRIYARRYGSNGSFHARYFAMMHETRDDESEAYHFHHNGHGIGADNIHYMNYRYFTALLLLS